MCGDIDESTVPQQQLTNLKGIFFYGGFPRQISILETRVGALYIIQLYRILDYTANTNCILFFGVQTKPRPVKVRPSHYCQNELLPVPSFMVAVLSLSITQSHLIVNKSLQLLLHS